MPALPFLQEAAVSRNGDVVATDMPISIWPAPSRVGDIGGVYDHEGEAPASFHASLRVANTRVTVSGKTYTVVDVQRHDFVPHCSLILREVSPGGLA
jgi:hypothetical protein